jgi:uncharacterized repeat protein (TIGR01451 family)
VGTIIAAHDITLTTSATVSGRVLARGVSADGAVTLDTNTISVLTCAVPTPVNGTCGTASKTYPYTAVSFGSDTLCSAGTASVTPTFPAPGNSTTWTCAGTSGGSSSGTCTATVSSAPLTPATLTLVKVIVGGTKTFSDFPLTATGPTTITGNSATIAVTNATVPAGSYILSETLRPDYNAGSWSCIKNPGSIVTVGDSVTLASGDSAICTIQNTYTAPAPASGYTPVVPPLIDVVKIPSPLALPAGPGPVTYTYTLKNIGTVPVTSITMVDDNCSPVALISGDTNKDYELDVNEVWTFTCTKTISATKTNTVVATGYANGISATDIANATVVVGAPIIPPLIHVTKIPNPLALPAGGGIVTYTNKVTNPGTISLSNVQLIDDKCASVKYISGDTNGDSKLDPSETWTYTCQSNLTKTTTNTVVATGQANGLTARDFAIATVIVATPKLPNTGFGPEGKNNTWNIVMIAGILLLISMSIVVALRKRTI